MNHDERLALAGVIAALGMVVNDLAAKSAIDPNVAEAAEAILRLADDNLRMLWGWGPA